MRNAVEPVTEPDKNFGSRTTHPAFGIIGASRITGQRNLFGSRVGHSGFIRLTIRHASVTDFGGHSEHVFGDTHITEVDLSEAQWVALISRMNHGQGTPCTINYTASLGHVPEIAHVEKAEEHLRSTSDRMAGMLNERNAQAIAELRKVIEKRVPKTEQESVLRWLGIAAAESLRTTDYFHKELRNTAERLTTEARIEIDAMLSGAISNLGLESAQQLGVILAADPKKAILLIADQSKKEDL